MQKYDLTFEQIFKQNGLYKSEGFVKGFCFEIFGTTKSLVGVQYKSKTDLMPDKDNFPCYESLFSKKYKRVYNISELFE